MLIRQKPSWEIKESEATPEGVYRNRRQILQDLGLGGLAASGAPAFWFSPSSKSKSAGGPLAEVATDPSLKLYPFPRNKAYGFKRPVTPEKIVATYNNFYEFGSQKDIWQAAQALKIRPWTIAIDGLVEKPQIIGIDDLLKIMPKEERLYRHRCVEAWSIAVPWSGFALKALVAFAKPLASAKFLAMRGFEDPAMAPGQNQSWYPWPYVEGLTMAEATNDLAFMVTGMYGKPLPPQNGAPLRLAVPWKYGFKSAKSLVRFTFTDKMPETFWSRVDGSEYGFWANVNPEVPHPRWSQASERELGAGKRIPTKLYNGYGAEVASLYANMPGATPPYNRKLFM